MLFPLIVCDTRYFVTFAKPLVLFCLVQQSDLLNMLLKTWHPVHQQVWSCHRCGCLHISCLLINLFNNDCNAIVCGLLVCIINVVNYTTYVYIVNETYTYTRIVYIHLPTIRTVRRACYSFFLFV